MSGVIEEPPGAPAIGMNDKGRSYLYPDDAVKITLDPNDCYHIGNFQYFKDNIIGMFVRIAHHRRPAGSNDNNGTDNDNMYYIWARVLGEPAAMPGPQYSWRGRAFDTFLVIEHPSIIGSTCVSFTQLAKDPRPTQEEIDCYCAGFFTEEHDRSSQGMPDDMRTVFLTLPEIESSVRLRPLGPDDIPYCCSVWNAWFNRFVRHRQPSDGMDKRHFTNEGRGQGKSMFQDIAEANARLANGSSNLVLPKINRSNMDLALRAKVETERIESVNMATRGDFVFGSPSMLPTQGAAEGTSYEEQQLAIFLSNKERCREMDSLVDLSEKNRRHNSLLQLYGERYFKEKTTRSAPMKSDMWVYDNEKRGKLCRDYDERKNKKNEEKGADNKGGAKDKGKLSDDAANARVREEARQVHKAQNFMFGAQDSTTLDKLIELASASVATLTAGSLQSQLGAKRSRIE